MINEPQRLVKKAFAFGLSRISRITTP